MRELNGLKVCFLAGTLGRGGAERQLLYMLRALRRLNVSTRVICLTKGEAFESDIKAIGVPVEWVGSSPYRPKRLWRISQSLHNDRPHILQSAHFYTNLYVGLAGRYLGIKNIGAIRSDLLSELRNNGWAGRWHLHLPQHLIANSRLAWQRVLDSGIHAQRVDFVPNAVDVDWLNEERTTNGHKTVRILFAGRLEESKRPDRFLRVVSRVATKLHDRKVKAVIVGDGPLRDSLRKLAAELGLRSDQIEILGETSNMQAVYCKADLLILTSDREGTPNVVLESLACSLPVIATRVGGLPEILGEDRGVIVEPGNEDQLVSAAVRLLNNSDLQVALGRRGREYVDSCHSLSSLQGQLEAVYTRVLSK